ncbi:MAG: hypothetical protein IT200_00820 [Thermoleophilia bacterium]|nr:hypothetical protein [Thermoleophilia bacterium]
MTRRRLLAAALAAPVVATFTPLLRTHAAAARGMAGALRPSPDGRADRRCASCGAPDHTMLDAACPARPRVR